MNDAKHTLGTLAAALLAVTVASMLTSCPNPLPVDLAAQITDSGAPVITISSPTDGATYLSTVTVTGTVNDPDGTVQRLSINVPLADLSESIEMGTDGSFSYAFSTAGLTETVKITLTAQDWNGNESNVIIDLFNDLTGPYIEITEPADRSTYGTVVRVSGTITDSAESDAAGEISVASYHVPGTSVGEEIQFGEDGSFSFEFATRLPDGTQVIDGPTTIEVTADDWNGNQTLSTVTILRAATGDISGVSVTPDNAQVTIEWDPVLYAESYTIFESRYGETREGVSSGYDWKGLENGEQYLFQVVALIPDELGDDAVSEHVAAIPVSARTLAPWVREINYGSIVIEWNEAAGVDDYVVERRTGLTGEWSTRRVLSETVFEDTRLDHGIEYAYRVSPFSQPDTVSAEIRAVPGRFGNEIITRSTKTIATGVAVSGSYTYVTVAGEGLAIFDTSDPADPGVPIYLEMDGNAQDIDIVGTRAYVALNGGVFQGLAIVDIFDPLNPSVDSYTPTNGGAWGVKVVGAYAYVANHTEGLAVINVSNPLLPQGPYYAATPGRAYAVDVDVSGQYAFVANYDNGIAIVDVGTTPTVPVTITNRPITGLIKDVDVVGDYAYVACTAAGLAIVDVSNPLDLNPPDPVYVYMDTNTNTDSVYVDGTTAYLTAWNLVAIDVSDPGIPGEPYYWATAGNGPTDVVVSDGYAYVADYLEGFTTMDVARPVDPGPAVTSPTSSWAQGIAVSGGYAYVATYSDGLAIFNVSLPLSPGTPVYRDTDGNALDVDIAGDFAYVADGPEGLAIIDVSDPTQPGTPVVSHTSDWVRDVFVAGPYAYLAVDDAGLAIVDITDPTQPGDPVYCDTTGEVYGVEVRDSYAYVAIRHNGLAAGFGVIDVSNPQSPVLLDEVADTDLYGYAVSLQGNYAFVATSFKGIAQFDISIPYAPVFAVLDYQDMTGTPVDVAVAGDFAFVADQADGLGILDISDPSNLTPPAPIIQSTGGFGAGVTISGAYAFVANQTMGLAVIQLWEEPE